MKKYTLICLMLIEIFVLILLIYLSVLFAEGKSVQSAQNPDITQPAQIQTTEANATTAPTKVTVSLPDPDNEYIGKLYTRMELYALENESRAYGPGKTSGGARPPYALEDQEFYADFGANFIAPDNGCIYLTFDCGYEYNNLTASILDTLKEKNVKAVFFITMSYALKNPALVERMIAEGHTVGNHSNSHREMPDLTIEEMVWEVMSLHTYVLEHFGYEMTLFRPPTGAFSTRSLAVVQSLGYKTVHWSFAYKDWDTDAQPDKNSALDKITSSHHSGGIYLLHAVSETNAAVLGDAIDFFRAQGYELALLA